MTTYLRSILVVFAACQSSAAPSPKDAPTPPPVRVTLALGAEHSCVQMPDRSVRCFGSNFDHQLGGSPLASSPRPVAVASLRNVAAVAAGGHHTCALLDGGTVACWGANGEGQLGDGTRLGRAAPAVVPGLARVLQLVAGGDHVCARLVDGSVTCWGSNQYGELGVGDKSARATPMIVRGLSGVAQIAAGARHTCALLVRGELRCWGDNRIGELGDGTRIERTVPTPVKNVPEAIAVAAGEAHTCAIAKNRTVRCWGDASPNKQAPEVWLVPGLTGVAQVAVSSRRSFARLASGAVVSWHNDWRYDPDDMHSLDRLGPPQTPQPAPVVGLTGTLELVAGSSHMCARLGDADVRCWGDDMYGQRGDGTASVQLDPVAVAGLRDVVELDLGGEHSCARLRDGTMTCWGSGDEAGQLGDGTSKDHPKPTPVPGLTNLVGIALGNYHTCALRRDGSVACWGNVGLFPLPDGSTVQGSAVPAAIPIGHVVTGLAAGGNQTCVLREKTVGCWDGGSRGPTPTPIPNLRAGSVSINERHACALLADGTIACWGQNPNGTLGDGTRNDTKVPTRVKGISTATQVVVGFTHSCALLGDATVACWGQNDFGTLGNGSTSLSLTPVPVTGLSNVVQIGAGGWNTCARLADGTVRCWGMSLLQPVRQGRRNDRLTPTVVANVKGAVEVAVGYAHACARLGDGTVRCWGTNRSGQLGDGTSLELDVPTSVVW